MAWGSGDNERTTGRGAVGRQVHQRAGDEDWHKSYGQVWDEATQDYVRNEQNWGRCTCARGEHHDG